MSFALEIFMDQSLKCTPVAQMMWDIRAIQTDDPTDASNHAPFYVSFLFRILILLACAS
jgi:hypothetical protein